MDVAEAVKRWCRHKPAHLKDSFLKIVKDLGFKITVNTKKEKGVHNYFSDCEIKNIENIKATKKDKNSSFEVYYYNLFKQELREKLKNLTDEKLLEKVKNERNLIQEIDVNDSIVASYDGHEMKIYCNDVNGHPRALFKKIIMLCILHCLENDK